MQIITAGERHFTLLQAFISPYEYSCVQLAENIRKKTDNIEILIKDNVLEKVEDILGVFYYDKTLLHCFPFASQEALEQGFLIDFENIMLEYLEGSSLRCVNGEKKASQIILSALEKNGLIPYQNNTYKLMTLEEAAFEAPEKLSCDDEIRRCYNQDFDSLFDLQKKYLAKEVAPAGKVVSDAECAISLRKILKEELCFALFSDEEVVAKANTNAIGINWVQIGGVYTHPLYRRNYYAWNLVSALSKRILKTSRKICLFVKEKNNPACLLYKRMGFVERGFYEISYFD